MYSGSGSDTCTETPVIEQALIWIVTKSFIHYNNVNSDEKTLALLNDLAFACLSHDHARVTLAYIYVATDDIYAMGDIYVRIFNICTSHLCHW